jgi:hypothetical protein
MSYNPKPTRVWSRVQHPCTFTLDVSYNSVFSPLTGKTTSLLEADYYNKLLYKGNILQYKKNTSNLTKSQRYSQICKGMWTNRTKSYATQTQTYTNPNTSNLKQVNFINVPTNGNITYIPGPFNFNIPAPNGCTSDVIKEGGSLLCNTIVNPCTNEVIDVTKVLECYPTYCSDVPGPIIDLCWNPKLDTWYPRENLTMPTSGTKWPEGYKGLVSAVTGCYNQNSYSVDGLNINEPTSGIIKVLEGTNGTISFKSNVTLTEVFLVGGGNAGLTGKFVSSSANGGWGGAGGGFATLNNITVLAGTPIILTVGTGGVYPLSNAIQSSFTYNGTTTVSVKDSNDWAGTQNNEGGLNNQSFGVNHVAQDGYQYDGVWYGGGGGYGGSVLASLGVVGGNGGLGGGGGGGGYTGSNGGSGGQGTGGTAGNVTVPAGGSSIYGGGGGYGIITGNGGNGGAGGGGAGGAGGVGGLLQAGGGGGGGVNTGGGGGGGGYPTDSGIPGNGGSGIIIIKYTVAV